MAVILSNTTVVGVDGSMDALSIQKPYFMEKLSKFLPKIVYSTILSAHAQCDYIVKAIIKLLQQKLW